MTGKLFCVANKPYCVWEADDSNKDTIRGIDPSYFSYLAAAHMANLQGEHRSKAVAALSTSYYHGLETLFMLIFAALQAPRCVSGWLLKCWPQQLRELVADLSVGKFPRAVRWKLQAGSWDSVSNLMNGKLFAGMPEANEMIESFGVLWTRFARDYTEELRIEEYNSFKHGFRIQVGVGPTVTIRQKADGSIPTPDQAKLPILQSDFGSSFCVEHELEDAHDPNLKHHFTLKFYHVNLQAEALAEDLELLRISIHNVVAFLKMANGFPEAEISVASSDEKEVFKQSEAKSGNLYGVKFSPKISENDIEKLTKEEILRRLEGR